MRLRMDGITTQAVSSTLKFYGTYGWIVAFRNAWPMESRTEWDTYLLGVGPYITVAGDL